MNGRTEKCRSRDIEKAEEKVSWECGVGANSVHENKNSLHMYNILYVYTYTYVPFQPKMLAC